MSRIIFLNGVAYHKTNTCLSLFSSHDFQYYRTHYATPHLFIRFPQRVLAIAFLAISRRWQTRILETKRRYATLHSYSAGSHESSATDRLDIVGVSLPICKKAQKLAGTGGWDKICGCHRFDRFNTRLRERRLRRVHEPRNWDCSATGSREPRWSRNNYVSCDFAFNTSKQNKKKKNSAGQVHRVRNIGGCAFATYRKFLRAQVWHLPVDPIILHMWFNKSCSSRIS